MARSEHKNEVEFNIFNYAHFSLLFHVYISINFTRAPSALLSFLLPFFRSSVLLHALVIINTLLAVAPHGSWQDLLPIPLLLLLLE